MNEIWPKQKSTCFKLKNLKYRNCESVLSTLFPGFIPVVVSSARSGLSLIARIELTTEDSISIFPYASQCVVKAFTSQGVSVYTNLNFESQIVLHQWGINSSDCNSVPFIEDVCDTFIKKGSNLLISGAKYEIWSLPKILGTRFGAVIWTQDNLIANNLRSQIKQNLGKTTIKYLARRLSQRSKRIYEIWEKMEFRDPAINKIQNISLLEIIIRWQEIYENRETAIKQLIGNQNEDIGKISMPTIPKNFINARTLNGLPSVLEVESIESEKNRKYIKLHQTIFGSRPILKTVFPYLREIE